MNNKILAAACGLLVSGVASAYTSWTDCGNFYVGGDVSYNKIGYYGALKDTVNTQTGTLKSKAPSFDVVGGYNFNQYWGLEAGYALYKKAKFSTATTDGGIKLTNLKLDVLGYLPVEYGVDLVGSLGVGRTKVKEVNDVNNNSLNNEKYNKVGLRLGAGVQYKFYDNFAARAMLGYQKVGAKNDLEFVKRITSVSLGVTYSL